MTVTVKAKSNFPDRTTDQPVRLPAHIRKTEQEKKLDILQNNGKETLIVWKKENGTIRRNKILRVCT
jgi:hypothetical protein